jgi:hypothetical protein
LHFRDRFCPSVFKIFLVVTQCQCQRNYKIGEINESIRITLRWAEKMKAHNREIRFMMLGSRPAQ